MWPIAWWLETKVLLGVKKKMKATMYSTELIYQHPRRWRTEMENYPPYRSTLYVYILHQVVQSTLLVLYIEFWCYFGFSTVCLPSSLYSIFLVSPANLSLPLIRFFSLGFSFSFSKNVLIKLRNKVEIRAFDTNQIEMLYENTQTHRTITTNRKRIPFTSEL